MQRGRLPGKSIIGNVKDPKLGMKVDPVRQTLTLRDRRMLNKRAGRFGVMDECKNLTWLRRY